MNRDRPSHGAALLAWIEAAQHALDHEATLSVDHIRALVAQPEGAQRVRDGVTWFLEEARRVLREDVADAMPRDEAAMDAWRRRHETRERRVESLLEAHADALACARPVVAGPTREARPRRRPTAAARAERGLAVRVTESDQTREDTAA